MNSRAMKDCVESLRSKMQEMLSTCTEPQQDVFRRMYDHKGLHAHPVNALRFEQFDNAFSQIERTMEKNRKEAKSE